MNSSKQNEIIQQIERYVTGSLSRSDYRTWLIDQVWDAENLDSLKLEAILYELEALDAEFTGGTWSEDELKAELRRRFLVSRLNQASA